MQHDDKVAIFGRHLHPDDLEDLREEARLNVLDLIKSGDVAYKDESEAFEEELRRLVTQ